MGGVWCRVCSRILRDFFDVGVAKMPRFLVLRPLRWQFRFCSKLSLCVKMGVKVINIKLFILTKIRKIFEICKSFAWNF